MMRSRALPKWEGIWRPPELGSSARPKTESMKSRGGLAEGEAEGEVAVVGDEPVVPGRSAVAARHLDRLVALAGDHEGRLALAVEDPHAAVHGAGQDHLPVHREEALRVETEGAVTGLLGSSATFDSNV